MVGDYPFNAESKDKLYLKISDGQFEFPRDCTNISDSCKNLIKSMLIVDSEKRISV